MPHVILKPLWYNYKNRFIRTNKKSLLNRERIVALSSILCMLAIYYCTKFSLSTILNRKEYVDTVPYNLLSMSSSGFFFLLLFSSCIAALSILFDSKDTALLLSAPISNSRLFASYTLKIILSSCWMVSFFIIPSLLAYTEVFALPSTFILVSALVMIPFFIIPAAIGCIAILILVNVCPAYRIHDLMALFAFLIAITLLIASQHLDIPGNQQGQEIKNMVIEITKTEDPTPEWLPSKWASTTLISYIEGEEEPLVHNLLTLLLTSLSLYLLANLTFNLFYRRGLNFALQRHYPGRIHQSKSAQLIGRILVPHAQTRAFITKEIKMFMRDTTQTLQLFILLFLTLLYIYNFRSLQSISSAKNVYNWWSTLLAIANIILGACVISAIATRFVFPSVSLEGRAYNLVRFAPLRIKDFLRYKFTTWLIPTTIISIVLLVSGAWAIQTNPQTVIATIFLAVCLSIGIVGLGIGIGTVYVKFDWENQAQVTASFGSLVYMFLALATIVFTLMPGSIIFVLTSIPAFYENIAPLKYTFILFSAGALVFMINYTAARWALNAGEQTLKELEA